MKTKDNVQKTILKSLAVVTSLVLLSITVNAQVFWRTVLENNSLNHIAMAMIETKATTSTANSEAVGSAEAALLTGYSTIESENPLNLEEWMTSDDAFKTNMFSFETEKEFALELENWMTADNFGTNAKSSSKNLSEDFKLQKDKDLQLESWMVDSSLWN